jgi:hypothetical protein
MILHLNSHEVAFNEIYGIVSQLSHGMHYPQYQGEEDTLYPEGITAGNRLLPDFLLREIGCKRIFCLGREIQKKTKNGYIEY